VLGGHLSLGTMLSASALGAGFLDPLASLVASGLQLQQLPSYMHRINDVLDTPREQHGRRLRPAPRLSGRIRAENVSFRYGAVGSAVVSQVSLEIQPGQHVGIVGRSGSGKSTLAHLLLGLYQPTSGRIEFDGQDLTVLDAGSVRRQVGIVTQRPYLFGASIRENIALTDPELPLQAIIAAARIACVHDDIAAMPMGYDTKLHGGGASISGGQCQRIALARALVHQPSIVLLDEATSELDTVTERQIYRNLEALSATTIVIAHRLSTVRNADLILVMEQGQVVEGGTHEQLLVRQGAYTALVHAQSAGGESAAGGLVPLWAHTPTA
jgi:ATP-binding cassette subfamily B protein